MSDDAAAPEGFSLAEFKSLSLDVGGWIWGTVQGAFNEKQSISQMIVDAVIGMIPVVGDVTAVRDLIAIVIGLVQDPRKREDKFQWMLLVILICALIPVVGGVIKGVGRVLVHTMGEVARIAEKSARSARLLEAARDMVALCNRVGVGNAEKWLKELKFAKYQDAILGHINELLVRIDNVITVVQNKLTWVVPSAIKTRIAALKDGIVRVKAMISDKIPAAIKQLDQDLHELQQLIYSGGETTSRAVSHTAEAGAKSLSRTEELILLEGKGATRSARGGFAQNGATAKKAGKWYKPEPGYPDLTTFKVPGSRPGDVSYPFVATYSGQIVNREIQPGEKIFRVFGPAGETHGVAISEAFGAGSPKRAGGPSFWGMGDAPPSAGQWRKGSAVLDEWNHDGYIIIGEVMPDQPSLLGCTGVIAEQQGEKLGVQFLPGGDKQAMLQIPAAVSNRVNQLAADVQKTGVAMKIDVGGISWEIRPTGWSDVNGVHGYLHMPGPGTVQTVRLGAKEIASKRDKTGGN